VSFSFPNAIVSQLFELSKAYYSILTSVDKRISTYKTLYFDTPKNNFYIFAHNGKRNRQTVRYKHCVESNVTYLEIKYIDKKGRDKKRKLKVDGIKSAFSEEEISFLKKRLSKKKILKLQPRLAYNFKRITLVDKSNSERISIDSDVKFIYNQTEVQSLEISFAQIKLERYSGNSRFIETLKDLGIRDGQIGKYVFGMSIFGKLKANLFSKETDRINKTMASYD
jgi:hypothetical protein